MVEYRLIEIANCADDYGICGGLEYYSYIAFRNIGILRETKPTPLFENPKVFENRKTNWKLIFSLRAQGSPEETIKEISRELVQNGFSKEDIITTEERRRKWNNSIEVIIPSEERVRLEYLENKIKDEIERKLK